MRQVREGWGTSRERSGAAARDLDDTEADGPDPRAQHLSMAIIEERFGAAIQRKASGRRGGRADAPEHLAAAADNAGTRLPAGLEGELSRATGADLSRVRVHDGAASNRAARSIDAEAHTVGSDIHFAAGMYDPGSARGRHLIAHEVAHAVQGREASRAPTAVSSAGHAHEREAESFADSFLRGGAARGPVHLHAAPAGMAHRRESKKSEAGAGGDSAHEAGSAFGMPSSPPLHLIDPKLLQLHIQPFSLFEPPPVLLDSLVTNWVAAFRASASAGGPAPTKEEGTHDEAPGADDKAAHAPSLDVKPDLGKKPPKPAPADPWTQLWTSWRQLSDQWIARGDGSLMNPTLARDLLQHEAASKAKAMGADDVPGKVWKAFEAALNKTQFYQRLLKRAEDLAKEHWPLLVMLAGTGVAATLGMGLREGKWEPMAKMTDLLAPLAKLELDIDPQTKFLFQLNGSKPIRPKEHGVGIGIAPSIGVRFSFPGGSKLTLESQANMRFISDEAAPNNFGFDWSVTPLNLRYSF